MVANANVRVFVHCNHVVIFRISYGAEMLGEGASAAALSLPLPNVSLG